MSDDVSIRDRHELRTFLWICQSLCIILLYIGGISSDAVYRLLKAEVGRRSIGKVLSRSAIRLLREFVLRTCGMIGSNLLKWRRNMVRSHSKKTTTLMYIVQPWHQPLLLAWLLSSWAIHFGGKLLVNQFGIPSIFGWPFLGERYSSLSSLACPVIWDRM